MGIEIIALLAAAAFLAYAILGAREVGLMVAVLAYAAVVGWIIQSDLSFLMAALGIAIVLGVMGVAVLVHREVSSQADTVGYTSRKSPPNNGPVSENIGS